MTRRQYKANKKKLEQKRHRKKHTKHKKKRTKCREKVIKFTKKQKITNNNKKERGEIYKEG